MYDMATAGCHCGASLMPKINEKIIYFRESIWKHVRTCVRHATRLVLCFKIYKLKSPHTKIVFETDNSENNCFRQSRKCDRIL